MAQSLLKMLSVKPWSSASQLYSKCLFIEIKITKRMNNTKLGLTQLLRAVFSKEHHHLKLPTLQVRVGSHVPSPEQHGDSHSQENGLPHTHKRQTRSHLRSSKSNVMNSPWSSKELLFLHCSDCMPGQNLLWDAFR